MLRYVYSPTPNFNHSPILAYRATLSLPRSSSAPLVVPIGKNLVEFCPVETQSTSDFLGFECLLLYEPMDCFVRSFEIYPVETEVGDCFFDPESRRCYRYQYDLSIHPGEAVACL